MQNKNKLSVANARLMYYLQHDINAIVLSFCE